MIVRCLCHLIKIYIEYVYNYLFSLCDEFNSLVCYCQVDLIDMQVKPPAGFRYIGHVMDHFSKFHFLFPLERKTQDEVNCNLRQIFSLIGRSHMCLLSSYFVATCTDAHIKLPPWCKAFQVMQGTDNVQLGPVKFRL